MNILSKIKRTLLPTILLFSFPVLTSAVLGVNDPIITNPLKAENFSEFLALVLNAVINVGVPILVLMFVYIGFMFVMARGKPAELQKAREAFLYGVLGAFLILGAFVLEKVITATLSPFLN